MSGLDLLTVTELAKTTFMAAFGDSGPSKDARAADLVLRNDEVGAIESSCRGETVDSNEGVTSAGTPPVDCGCGESRSSVTLAFCDGGVVMGVLRVRALSLGRL